MTAIARSLRFICIVVLLGLDIVGAEAVGQPVRAVGLWLIATALLCGCGGMVLWPRQLVASHARNLGTRRPQVARGFGVFGLVMAGLFEALASAWSGSFLWPTFLVASTASGLCTVLALRSLGKKLNPMTGRRVAEPTGATTSSPFENS